MKTTFWRRFADAHPVYLARYYWWAYLWRVGVWFFDHQLIINAILFGQYRVLSRCALRACTENAPAGRFLQLTCVYGNLTPALMASTDVPLYLADVADIQLRLAKRKAGAGRLRLQTARMNAEYLAYSDNAFATLLIFFLLHEMPAAARQRTLDEVLRVLRPGGRLVITEYGSRPLRHWLWRVRPLRLLLLRLEPFLGDFWLQDLDASLKQHARMHGKQISLVDEFHWFAGFYRVCVFELDE